MGKACLRIKVLVDPESNKTLGICFDGCPAISLQMTIVMGVSDEVACSQLISNISMFSFSTGDKYDDKQSEQSSILGCDKTRQSTSNHSSSSVNRLSESSNLTVFAGDFLGEFPSS